MHYPDRVRAALPAAGYLNAQAYVPLTHARGERFADPALRRVLESALTPDNNDLFLGNVADSVPILAIHGWVAGLQSTPLNITYIFGSSPEFVAVTTLTCRRGTRGNMSALLSPGEKALTFRASPFLLNCP